MTEIILPDRFIQTICGTFGEPGRAWLSRLPALVEACRQTWSLTLGEPFPLSYNYVAPGVQADGRPVVLKIGVPTPELAREMAALRLIGGQGMVRLLDALPERGAMLLERILPGTLLSTLEDDEEATRILADQMRRIWLPLDPGKAGSPTDLAGEHSIFTPLEEWTEGLRQYGRRYGSRCSGTSTGLLPARLVDRALGMLDELLASQGGTFLLHGDLHHENVLRSDHDGWLAIDPKGIAGEREFDAGPMMGNPLGRIRTWPDLKAILGRRLDILSEVLGFDRPRLLGWCFVEAVLSMAWDIEGGSPEWGHGLPVAEALEGLMEK